MNIFEKFDAILSSYELNKAKRFVNAYKGRISTRIDDNKLKEIWFNLVSELQNTETPEEFFKVLEKRGSSVYNIVKDTMVDTLNTSVLKSIEESVINDQYYKPTEDLIQKCKNNSFSNIEDLFPEVLNNSEISFNRIKRLMFDYSTDMNFYNNKNKIFDKISKMRVKGEGKTDSVNNNFALRHAYDELFGNKDRMILPINAVAGEGLDLIDLSTEYLNNCLPIIVKYFNSIGDTKEAEAVEDFIKNTQIADIADNTNPLSTGMYKFLSRKKEVRFGKILNNVLKVIKNKSENFELKDVAEIKRLNTMFNQREVNPKEKVYLVLSRHPYDIAGMSTGRGWTSCQTLDNREYTISIASTIEAGKLICYFCRESDTINIKDSSGNVHSPNEKGKLNREKRGAININIQKPLGRVLVKTYTYNGNNIDFDDKNFVLRVSSPYGTIFDDAQLKLQEWLDTNWNNKIIKKFNANYSDFIFTKGQYLDRFDNRYFAKELF